MYDLDLNKAIYEAETAIKDYRRGICNRDSLIEILEYLIDLVKKESEPKQIQYVEPVKKSESKQIHYVDSLLERHTNSRWMICDVQINTGTVFEIYRHGQWRIVRMDHDGYDYYTVPYIPLRMDIRCRFKGQ